MIRGEIWWADLGLPQGSGPGFRRPVVIIQDDAFNRSRISTVIVASITSNLALAEAPGNVFLDVRESNLPKDSVINVSQIATLDKLCLIEKAGELPPDTLTELNQGLELVFGLH